MMNYFLESVGYDLEKVVAAFTFYNSGTLDFTKKITGENSINNPGFGYDISTNVDGNFLLAGAVPSISSNVSGEAHAYTKDIYGNWNIKQTFNTGNISGLFGYSVANNDDASILLIGAPKQNSNTGCVHIYTGTKENGWSLKQVLSGNNFLTNYFGYSLSTNSGSSVIAVGSPYDNEVGSSAGMVWLFTGNRSNGWAFAQKLSGDPSLGARSNDFFGNSISMSKDGEIINITAPNTSTTIVNMGVAWIYTGDQINWNLKQIISGQNDATLNRRFGMGISNNDNSSIIVVSQRNSNQNPSGAVWLYTGSKTNNYVPVQKLAGFLNSANAAVSSKLPVSMNNDGSLFVFGLPYFSGTNPNSETLLTQSGIVEVYTGLNNRWELKNMLSGDAFGVDRFGYSTAINNIGSEIFIGGPQDIDNEILPLYSGSVWIYRNYGNNIVPPEDWADNSSYGILNTSNNFFQNIGTGFFNGSTIMKLNNSYTFENDTILLSYEKLRTGDEILLSSATGNSFATYSGFCLGVNHANKLYFKYWNSVEGAFTFTMPNILSNKNLILLNRDADNLTIGTLNNNTVEFELNDFNIKNNVFIQNSDLFLGGMYNNVPWANDGSTNFSGYVDKFYIIKDIPILYKDSLISGIIYTGFQSQGYNENYCYTTGIFTGSGFSTSGITGFLTIPYNITGTGITGYLNIITGYSYSGITGYRNVSQGFFSYCNNIVQISGATPISGLINVSGEFLQELTGLIITTGYDQIPLTGNITGINQIYITGQICNTFFIETGIPIFYKNNGYLKSLSFSEISLISTLNKQSDIIEVYHDNFIDRTLNYNNDLIFNFADNSFINNNFIESGENLPSGALLFLNGQALIDSGFLIQTIGYDSYVIPNIDYYQSGNTIFVNEAITETDNLFYDYITGDSKILYRTGIFSGFQLVGENFINKFVFINGQKLVSGATYTGINTINLNFPSGDNFILIKSIPSFNYYSGNNSTVRLIKQNLNKDSSQVYLNGIKQKLGNNYIENSDFDLFSGDFFENQNNYIIYNNTDDFFV